MAEETEVQMKARVLADELKYEKEFYEDEEKDLKANKYPPTIVMVQGTNGQIMTGKWLFISECPKGYLCAQPDGTLEDEDRSDWNHPENN